MSTRVVVAPASSANLGPGFDTLGLAVDLPFTLAVGPRPPAGDGRRFHRTEPAHPAATAFLGAGGTPDEPLWWASPIPPGRGLGYSGAARVAGAYLAAVMSGSDHGPAVDTAFGIAADLEGHADNAAASAYGGLCVAGGFGALRVPVPDDVTGGLSVIVWSPEVKTSTDAARGRLPDEVALPVAVGSIGRTALWVAAMVTGRLDMLADAAVDELHQPTRLERVPASAAVLADALDDETVLAAWLSGSGPTIAMLAPGDRAPGVGERVGSAHPDGHVRVLAIASRGVRTEDPATNS